MGMTDKQFNAFLRMLLKRIKEIETAKSPEEKEQKIDELLEEIQKDIED